MKEKSRDQGLWSVCRHVAIVENQDERFVVTVWGSCRC